MEHWGSDVTRLEVSGQRSSPGNILRDVADRSGGGGEADVWEEAQQKPVGSGVQGEGLRRAGCWREGNSGGGHCGEREQAEGSVPCVELGGCRGAEQKSGESLDRGVDQ